MNLENTRCLAIKKDKNKTQCTRTKKPDSNYCGIHGKINEREFQYNRKIQMELNMARCRKYGLLRYDVPVTVRFDRTAFGEGYEPVIPWVPVTP